MKISLKRRSIKSENQAAKEIGGRRQPASGAINVLKGDVKSSRFLLEDKFTDKKTYLLDSSMLAKIEREAFSSSRQPLVRMTIQGKTWYLLPQRVFSELLEGSG